MKRLAFCGGGTGGHVGPAAAVIEEYDRIGGVEAVLLGTGRVGEQKVAASAGIESLRLYGSGRGLTAHINALLTARRFLEQYQPDVVIGLGGYASVAGVVAAKSLGLRIVLLEQNAIPGRATDRLAGISESVLGGLPCMRPPGNFRELGTPVRSEIATLAALPAERTATCRELLVLGGSQGSRMVSEAALSAIMGIEELRSGWTVSHQTVSEDVDRIENSYRDAGIEAAVRPFFDDIPQRLSRGPLVVSRAGGTTIAELACAGVPSVLIPHAAAIRNHQMRNAEAVARESGAMIVGERSIETLSAVISELVSSPLNRVRLARGVRRLARPEAALAVVSYLERGLRVGKAA